MIFLYGSCFCANLLEGMGSSGKVVNLVVGKEVTSIGSQFQKTYIGTPTAKLSLTLEEGSKLSSIGNDAFKDNTFFVSIDLSNAGNLTMGASSFNNLTNLTEFTTNSGTLTLNTLALGNLKKLQTLNWRASSTNLNWTTGLTATVTFTSKATTSATTTNSDTKTSSTTGAATITWATATGGNSSHYPTGKGTVGTSAAAASTLTGDLTNTSTATTTVTATYAWTGTDNTGNHPMYNLSNSVAAGNTLNLRETVVSIPNYAFTTGIYAFETKSATLTRTYTATGASNFTITKTTSGTAAIPTITANGAAVNIGRLNNANYGNVNQNTQVAFTSIGATSHSITRSGKLTVSTTVTQTCTITEGVKLSKPTGIKIGRVNSFSKKLTSIGQSAFGWIQIPITSANNDLPSAAVTSTFTATPTATAARSSTTAAVTAKLSYSGHQWYNFYCGTTGTSSTSWYGDYWVLYTGTSYANYATYRTGGSGAHSSNGWFSSAANAQSMMKTVFNNAVTCTANDSIATTVTSGTITIPASATTTKVWSTVNNTVTAGSATGSNGMPSGSILKIANFGIAGPNMTINSGAFIGAKVLEQVYLAGTVENVNAIAFSTRNTGSTDKIYVYGKSAIGEFTTSTGLSAQNDMAIEYRKDAKDLGRYINHYQIGASVYAYLFETDPDKYLINIVGSGATYDTYTASNRPAWAASYATKVTQLIVDDTVTGIGPYLFYGHTALTSVQFGTGLTSIGAHAFGNCTGLDSFTVPATLTSVGERILEGAAVKTVYYNANTEDAYHSMSGCDANEIILGANVTKIGDGTLGDISGIFFVKAGEALKYHK